MEIENLLPWTLDIVVDFYNDSISPTRPAGFRTNHRYSASLVKPIFLAGLPMLLVMSFFVCAIGGLAALLLFRSC